MWPKSASVIPQNCLKLQTSLRFEDSLGFFKLCSILPLDLDLRVGLTQNFFLLCIFLFLLSFL